VKTRLGREIGFSEATVVYRELAEQQLRRVPGDCRTEVHYAPRGAAGEVRQWLGSGFTYRVQRGGDLGERLDRAFDQGFRRGYGPVIAIGSDCPELDEDCLRRAIKWLADTDVVLGPASDGGYYLIGLRRPAPRVFEDIAWGTSTVLVSTRARIKECGLSSRLLEEKDDIDDLAGLQRHVAGGTVGAKLLGASLAGG
jgi:hypothetical protein